MRVNIVVNPLNIPKHTLDLKGTPYISKFNPDYKNSNLENIVAPLPKTDSNINIDTSYYESVKQKFVLKDGSMQLDETVNNPLNSDFCDNNLDCDYIDSVLYNDSNGLDDFSMNNENIDEYHSMISEFLGNDKVVLDILDSNGYVGIQKLGFTEKVEGIMDFFYAWKEYGFFTAMYGKPFPQLVSDFFVDLFNIFVKFFLGNSDMFFLLPLMLILIFTFFFGKNKYTKLAIPFGFGYFVSKILFIIFYKQ